MILPAGTIMVIADAEIAQAPKMTDPQDTMTEADANHRTALRKGRGFQDQCRLTHLTKKVEDQGEAGGIVTKAGIVTVVIHVDVPDPVHRILHMKVGHPLLAPMADETTEDHAAQVPDLAHEHQEHKIVEEWRIHNVHVLTRPLLPWR